MKRRAFLRTAVIATFLAAGPAAASIVVDVYKSPTCGCCTKWIAHLRSEGFVVTVHDIDNVDLYRTRVGVPSALSACHTAHVDGYVVEGHVPAADIRKLLAQRPKAMGLAVPGMPLGSPGMDALHTSGYEVLLFQPNGATQVYHAYPPT
jgi:hypothetical protein